MGARPARVDIVARKGDSVIGVEVKHTRRVITEWVSTRFAVIASTSANECNEWWLITSAQLDTVARAMISDAAPLPIRIIDGAELRKWSETQAAAEARKQITVVTLRRSRQWVLAILMSLLASWGLFQDIFSKKAPLDVGIENVTAALKSLKDLEGQLTTIKSDMAETERARLAIIQEYTKAKELEKLTNAQLAAVRDAVRQRSWKQVILENAWAFLLGFASSIFASLGWEKYTRWRSQSSE